MSPQPQVTSQPPGTSGTSGGGGRGDGGGAALVRAQRLVIGLLTLLLVDIIWVASSELTEYIFKSQHYNKPFFSTYLKTSLFMLYLPGFVVYKPWRDQCQMGIQLRRLGRGGAGAGAEYAPILESDTDTGHSDAGDSAAEDEVAEHGGRSLSEPTFQPIRSTEGTDSEADVGRSLHDRIGIGLNYT